MTTTKPVVDRRWVFREQELKRRARKDDGVGFIRNSKGFIEAVVCVGRSWIPAMFALRPEFMKTEPVNGHLSSLL